MFFLSLFFKEREQEIEKEMKKMMIYVCLCVCIWIFFKKVKSYFDLPAWMLRVLSS